MNKEDIIRMAREAGIVFDDKAAPFYERFAALVAAASASVEREACANVCEEGIANATDWDSSYWDQACENRAATIRARGETTSRRQA